METLCYCVDCWILAVVLLFSLGANIVLGLLFIDRDRTIDKIKAEHE